MYQHVIVPAAGAKITVKPDFSLVVPANPIIPYIEGDGTGVDITPVMLKVVDAAVQKAYGGTKKIVDELNAVQGKPADIGGYYLSSPSKAGAVMRPSATFNAAIDALAR